MQKVMRLGMFNLPRFYSASSVTSAISSSRPICDSPRNPSGLLLLTPLNVLGVLAA